MDANNDKIQASTTGNRSYLDIVDGKKDHQRGNQSETQTTSSSQLIGSFSNNELNTDVVGRASPSLEVSSDERVDSYVSYGEDESDSNPKNRPLAGVAPKLEPRNEYDNEYEADTSSVGGGQCLLPSYCNGDNDEAISKLWSNDTEKRSQKGVNSNTNSKATRFMISRRRRSDRRRNSANTFDNDHDGDIDRRSNSDSDEIDHSRNCGKKDNDYNVGYDDNYSNASEEGNSLKQSLEQEDKFFVSKLGDDNNNNRWQSKQQLSTTIENKQVFLRHRTRQANKQLGENMTRQSFNIVRDGSNSVGAVDENNNCLEQYKKVEAISSRKPSQSNISAQSCDDKYSGNLISIRGSLLLLKRFFLREQSSGNASINRRPIKTHNHNLTSFQKTSDIELDCRQSTIKENVGDKQSTTFANRMPINCNNRCHRASCSYDDCCRPIIARNQLRKSQAYDKYTKLNHHHYQSKTSKPPKSFQTVKRLLLLLLIISLSCILLWKLYDVLTEDYNYLGFVESPSKLGHYENYAVSTDAKPCARIGKALLEKGGSAVDAALGTLICMGVALPNSLGLGGGCLMTIYERKTRKAVVIDGRETAPDYATENMFEGQSLMASRGPLSVGIPGELAAYEKAHRMFGKLNWSEIFEDSIRMAEEGSPMVEHLAYALRSKNHAQYITKPMAKLFLNKSSNAYLDEGDILVQKELAETLKRIRDHGAKEFYGGQTGQNFIKDLQEQGGNITLKNLMKYEALVKEPYKFNIADDLILYTQPPPGSGLVLSIILRIMKELGYYKNLKPQESFEGSSLYYHRLVEAFKFAYAQRAGIEDMPDDKERMRLLVEKLMSDEYINEVVQKIDNKTHDNDYYGGLEYFSEDHGTAHVSVIDSEGNAVAITSSVNLYFGSGIISPSTGIIFNDIMDDFVSPNLVNKFGLAPSKYNRIRPGRRPLSSMAPSVFTDIDGNVKLAIGASGGSKITTAIASVSLRNCFLGEDIKTAIDGPRLHHQFFPNKIWYEISFPQDLLHSLMKVYGHGLQPITDRSSVVMAVTSDQVNGTNHRHITANSDYRKGGTVDGI